MPVNQYRVTLSRPGPGAIAIDLTATVLGFYPCDQPKTDSRKSREGAAIEETLTLAELAGRGVWQMR